MIRRCLVTVRLVIGIAMAIALLAPSHFDAEAATCEGKTPCKACKNCSACKHCHKDRGTCGVCKKP